MDAVEVQYIPATIRAAMARLRLPQRIELENETYELSPGEMPGEVEWRGDFLRWLARKTFHYLVMLPREEWVSKLLAVEESLISDTWLHMLEAQAVTEGALLSIMNLPPSDIEGLRKAHGYFDAANESEGTKLLKRYSQMVRQHARVAANKGVSEGEMTLRTLPAILL